MGQTNNNNMIQNKLTLDEAFRIQKDQMEQWQKILKPEVFTKFKDYVDRINTHKHMKDSYDVPRGTELQEILHNQIAPVI